MDPQPLIVRVLRKPIFIATLAVTLCALTLHRVLPSLALRWLSRSLAKDGIHLSASAKFSLPNKLQLSDITIQRESPPDRADAKYLLVTFRLTDLLRGKMQHAVRHLELAELRGSWSYHPKNPHPPESSSARITPAKDLPLPDSLSLRIASFSIELPPKPGAQTRKIAISELALSASTTDEGLFRVGSVTVGDTPLLVQAEAETNFFEKKLSIRELKVSGSDLLEHLRMDLGDSTGRPSLDFLLLRKNGYISGKASLTSSHDGPSLSVKLDAENVDIPIDPFASNPEQSLPRIDIYDAHATFEGLTTRPSSWRSTSTFSGALATTNPATTPTKIEAKMTVSERALRIKNLSIDDPATQITTNAVATLVDNQSPLETLSDLTITSSIQRLGIGVESPLDRLLTYLGLPLLSRMPPFRLDTDLRQSPEGAVHFGGDFMLQPDPGSPSSAALKGTFNGKTASLSEFTTGSLTVETAPFTTHWRSFIVSVPATKLSLAANTAPSKLTVEALFPSTKARVETALDPSEPWMFTINHLPLREIFTNLTDSNKSTLSAKISVHGIPKNNDALSGEMRLEDPSTGTLLTAIFSGQEGTGINTHAELQLHQRTLAKADLQNSMKSPHLFQLTSDGDIADAHPFRHLLELAAIPAPKGSKITWSAKLAKTDPNEFPKGSFALDGNKLSVGPFGPFDAKVRVTSDGSSIESKGASIQLGETSASGNVRWSDRLEVSDLKVLQRNRPALKGDLSVHYPLLQSDGPVGETPLRANFQADQLELGSLFGDAPLVSGKLQGSVELSGTLDRPQVKGHLTAPKLLPSKALSFIGPVTLDIQAFPAPGTLSVSARITSALNAPLEIQYSGSVWPFISRKPATHAADSPSDSLRILLKGGSLQALNQLPRIFKSVTGNIDIALAARNTNSGWKWDGETSIKAPKFLFESPRAPGLSDLNLKASFSDSGTAHVDLSTSSGGGNITVKGDVQHPISSDPLFDLVVKTKNVLAYRNESLLLRADSDLTFRGRWSNAEIRGEASPVQSKYLHDIEILPFSLTRKGEGRSALKGLSPGFSFTQAPYSNWKFNIHFKSRAKDPLLVRGNRWQGEAEADMIWGGTGLRPWFEGYYHSKNLTAFLPSIKLSVNDGYLWYKRDAPFQGTLDVNALTTARGYRISAYISGPLSQPDLLLTSKPALDQPDILSLLTTGVLPSDTNDSPQVIAARATEALAEDVSRSLLGVDRRMIEGIGRIDVEFSRVNPRTGQQETRVTRRLNEDWSMSGDIGSNGDFTGRLKFLHRFK